MSCELSAWSLSKCGYDEAGLCIPRKRPSAGLIGCDRASITSRRGSPLAGPKFCRCRVTLVLGNGLSSAADPQLTAPPRFLTPAEGSLSLNLGGSRKFRRWSKLSWLPNSYRVNSIPLSHKTRKGPPRSCISTWLGSTHLKVAIMASFAAACRVSARLATRKLQHDAAVRGE
jgi:hypothetical protein